MKIETGKTHPWWIVLFLLIFSAACSDAAIDRCLDRGGSYDYARCRCDFENNHAYTADHDC